MDEARRVAIYARVSSQAQADEATIQSQVVALEERVAADRHRLDPTLRFLDEGYSGGTLFRPALERLRDLVFTGGLDRLYVHSPDRLARKLVLQMVLLDELAKHRVDVVFLNMPQEVSPESNLLLQIQGMIAEYERAKILERTRRGRRHQARQGRVSVLGHAPYGYRYVRKADGEGEARYEVVEEEARWVREVFGWVALEGLSLGAVVRRLAQQQVPTRQGHARWNPCTIRGILSNPAYYGQAHWGKTRAEPRSSERRAARGRPAIPRQEKVSRPTPWSEQERIAVPALIRQEMFDVVQERLAENRRHQRERMAGATYLLSGLLVCGQCGAAYCARRSAKKNGARIYYRCLSTDKHRRGGEVLCSNPAVPGTLEAEVWSDLCELVQNPERLRKEWERRQQASAQGGDGSSIRASMRQLEKQKERLVELYQMGYLNQEQFTTRMERVTERLARETKLYEQQKEAEQLAHDHAQWSAAFDQFRKQLPEDMAGLDFTSKRRLLRLMVKRIVVGEDQVEIVYKVQPLPENRLENSTTNQEKLQHRLKSQLLAGG